MNKIVELTAGQKVGAIVPRNFTDVEKMASFLATSSSIPQTYRGKPIEIGVTIMHGAELGMGPIEALNSFDNIKGTVAPKAETMRRLFVKLGGRIEITWNGEGPALECTASLWRDGQDIGERSFSMAEAKAAGLLGKNTWQSHPKDMLIARASSKAIRTFAPDVMSGMRTSEEVEEIQLHDAETKHIGTVKEITGGDIQLDVQPREPHTNTSEAGDMSKKMPNQSTTAVPASMEENTTTFDVASPAASDTGEGRQAHQDAELGEPSPTPSNGFEPPEDAPWSPQFRRTQDMLEAAETKSAAREIWKMQMAHITAMPDEAQSALKLIAEKKGD